MARRAGTAWPRCALKIGKRARAARQEALRRFKLSDLVLKVVELPSGSFCLESEVVASLAAGDLDNVLICMFLDDAFRAQGEPDGCVLIRHDVFSSRRSAERSAGIWRAKFARMDGSGVMEV